MYMGIGLILRSVWVWNLVCHIRGRTQVEGVENGVLGEISRAKRGRVTRGLEKIS
jgi:hypothetical protein